MNTIAAIPTLYAGVMFRSRLEARWAATFDLCGVPWQYEPFDLDGYIPDFRLSLWDPQAQQVHQVIAEVKPIDDIEDLRKTGDAAKMSRALAHGRNSAPHLFSGKAVVVLGLEGASWLWAMGHNGTLVDKFQKVWREAGNRVQWRRHNP